MNHTPPSPVCQPRNPVAADACPVLCWWGGALVWLVAGGGLAWIASLQLLYPELLAGHAWTTYGRLQPAGMNALLYGFAIPAGLGLCLHLLGKGRRCFLNLAACLLWNLGSLAGVIGILAGDSSGIASWELPPYANGLLTVAILVPALQMVRSAPHLPGRDDYPSPWHMLIAVVWLVLVWNASFCVLSIAPWRGAAHLAAATWFANNLHFLWFAPIGLAAAYYLFSQQLARPLYSGPLAQTTFWLLACFGTAGGFHYSLPLPRWLSAVSSVSDILVLSAAAGLAWNLRQTIAGEYRKTITHPGLRLIGFGVLAWMLALLLQALLSRPGLRDAVAFTWMGQARLDLLVFGFCLLVMTGAIWIVTPQISGREWPCRVMGNTTTWGLPIGIILLTAGHLLAGLRQGEIINQPGYPFLNSLAAARPYLWLASAGTAVLAIASLACLGNLALLVWDSRQDLFVIRPSPSASDGTSAPKRTRAILLPALLLAAVSWLGLVWVPYWQLGSQSPIARRKPASDYPSARPGLAQQGSTVYRSLGCAECHTQQVRPLSTDQSRGWGQRRTVARDFLFDQPIMTGRIRIGPDLANLGSRLPEQFSVPWKLQNRTNRLAETTARLWLHLYYPQQFAPGSVMPRYRFLFLEQPIVPHRMPAPESLALAQTAGLPPGRLLPPTPEAEALAAYLLSLQADFPLFEAPAP